MNKRRFIDYVYKFYGRGGLYPIKGVTKAEIGLATELRILREPFLDFDGDTIDRERVRDILTENREEITCN